MCRMWIEETLSPEARARSTASLIGPSVEPQPTSNTFPSLGPWILSAKEAASVRQADGLDVPVSARVNGELVSDPEIRYVGMDWTFEEIVAYASVGVDLVAGDDIQTIAIGFGTAALSAVQGKRASCGVILTASTPEPVFEFLEDWPARYQQIIDLGNKLPPLPSHLKTEANRIHGCQATVHMSLRQRPDEPYVVEFLAHADAEIVNGLIALLERLFSGQRADQILGFDVVGFFRRVGLDQHLSLNRRNGLDAMVRQIRKFAVAVVHGDRKPVSTE